MSSTAYATHAPEIFGTEQHVHRVQLVLDRFHYSICDDCKEQLPFEFDLSWTALALVKAAAKYYVDIDFREAPEMDDGAG